MNSAPEGSVDDNLTFLLMIGVWVLLQAVVFPALGVPT